MLGEEALPREETTPRPGDGACVVLVVDDEVNIHEQVGSALAPAGFHVVGVRRGADAMRFVAERLPALVLLELALRDMDGVTVCQTLRNLAQVPVVFLSANQDDDSKVLGLRWGDDYVVKPFSSAELRARVEAALRRATLHQSNEIAGFDDGRLLIDLGGHRVFRCGTEISLTPTEYRLLSQLVLHRGRVILHADLLAIVWGEAYRDDHHLLRLHVTNLRKKIEHDPARPCYVKTRHGLGYVFDPRDADLVERAAG